MFGQAFHDKLVENFRISLPEPKIDFGAPNPIISTKFDAEYNLPTRVPKTRVNTTKRRIPGVDLRVHHVLPRVPHNICPPHHNDDQLGFRILGF
jgi:hypothetical protein